MTMQTPGPPGDRSDPVYAHLSALRAELDATDSPRRKAEITREIDEEMARVGLLLRDGRPGSSDPDVDRGEGRMT